MHYRFQYRREAVPSLADRLTAFAGRPDLIVLALAQPALACPAAAG